MKNRSKLLLILAIILTTLLLHILFLYFFTTVQFTGRDTFTEFIQKFLGTDTEEEKQLQSHAPAHSAPVVFQDDPEDEKPQSVQPQIPEPPQILVAHASNPLQKDPIKQEDPIQKTLIQQQEQKEEQPKKVSKEPKKPKEPDDISPAPEPEKDFKKPAKLESTMLTELADSKKVKELVQRAATPSERPKKLSAPSKTGKSAKSLSLADLGKQFMNKVSASIDTGGYGALQVQGAGYGHPSAYQIALERYVTKMCKEIETSYRIYTNQSIQGTEHKPFCLLVELNSNGSINTIYPTISSGAARIDEFAMSVFRSASSSFPKLPDAMGSSFRIQFGINHIDHMAYLSKGGTLSMH